MDEEEFELSTEGYTPLQLEQSKSTPKYIKMSEDSDSLQGDYVEASLKGAEFVGRDSFKVKDYVKGKEASTLQYYTNKAKFRW